MKKALLSHSPLTYRLHAINHCLFSSSPASIGCIGNHNDIQPQYSKEQMIRFYVSSALNTKHHLQKVFKEARNGNANSAKCVGVWLAHGHNLPIDKIEAKKHFLRAALQAHEDNNFEVNSQAQANLLALDSDITISCFLKKIETSSVLPFDKAALTQQLADFITQYGPDYAPVEKEVFKPFTLKQTCTFFAAQHLEECDIDSLPGIVGEEQNAKIDALEKKENCTWRTLHTL